MKEERGTLRDFSTNLTKDDLYRRDKLLMAMHQLSNIQIQFARQIEEILNKGSMYRHEIKHNHNEIKRLLEKNMKNIFGNMSEETIERYCEETDALEKAICGVLGIETEKVIK